MPNVILITVDTLRADHLGCYGHYRNASVNIDRFAEDSMLFENCMSHAPVTSSSCASMLSGFLPHETKVFKNDPLPADVQILPEILRGHGYKTIAVISNYTLQAKNGWDKGFDEYDYEMTHLEINRKTPERIAEHTTNRAIELFEKYHKKKLFMWIHYQDPHGPYTPPERFAKLYRNPDQEPRILKVNRTSSGYGGIPNYQKLRDNRDYYYYASQYDREIHYLDEQFEPLINTLKDLGVYDEDLIIFSADHGEGLGEHNYYFAHGENLYNSQNHVPLIMKYKKKLKGRRTDFTQHLDILPTILNIAGIKPDLPYRGTDLRKPIRNKEIVAEVRSPMVKDGTKFSLIIEGMKLIYTQINRKVELFDLKIDPYEGHNLAAQTEYAEQKKELFARLVQIQKEDLLGITAGKSRKRTNEEIEKMKSLGYVE